jgi:hypothetical protein
MAVKFATIVQGEDRTLNLVVKTSEGEPFDLTGATEIDARFMNEDRTVLSKLLSLNKVVINEAKLGKLSVILAAAETALMKAGERQSFEVHITIGGEVRIVQYLQNLTIKSQEIV